MTGRELAARALIGLPGPDLDQQTEDLLRAYPPAGVILFKRNVGPEAERIIRLTESLQEIGRSEAGREMIIAIDQEGGPVKRLPPPFGQYPAAADYLARFGPRAAEAVFDWGVNQGRELKALGITLNLAPVLDINTLGERGTNARRVFGTDPETVTELGLAAIRGLWAGGVAACAKHFPGMGQVDQDPHQEVRPRVDRSLEELWDFELVPFRRAAAEGVEAVMTSHLVYSKLDPDRPASLSEPIIRGLLKQRLGYRGLVLTDDLDMGAITMGQEPQAAARTALAAGADLILLCQRLDSFRRLVEEGD